ncbi:unnamed protein product [Merluccius merluccius]
MRPDHDQIVSDPVLSYSRDSRLYQLSGYKPLYERFQPSLCPHLRGEGRGFKPTAARRRLLYLRGKMDTETQSKH